MTAWLIMFLATNVEWKNKVEAEVEAFNAAFASHAGDSKAKDTLNHLAAEFSKIPLSIWEEELSVIDLCLRESIRIVQSAVFLRRNLSKGSIEIDGYTIGPGDFVVYPTADIHHNNNVYPNPHMYVLRSL